MRAMILAAGRGERMRPLTDTTPKPLLQVGGKPLIQWHIERLVRAGITELVINHAWLGAQIEQTLGDGARYGARIRYSPESIALETAGGIVNALACFDDEPFLVVNGDIWCGWDRGQAHMAANTLHRTGAGAWLLLVDNPAQHPKGDFVLDGTGRVLDKTAQASATLTFAGIGVYSPALFHGMDPGQPAALAPLLRAAMQRHDVVGAHYTGPWVDVGTPERLAELDASLRN